MILLSKRKRGRQEVIGRQNCSYGFCEWECTLLCCHRFTATAITINKAGVFAPQWWNKEHTHLSHPGAEDQYNMYKESLPNMFRLILWRKSQVSSSQELMSPKITSVWNILQLENINLQWKGGSIISLDWTLQLLTPLALWKILNPLQNKKYSSMIRFHRQHVIYVSTS